MSTLKIEHIANIANSGPDVSIDTNGHVNIVNGSLQMGGTTMLDTSDTSLKNITAIGIGTTSPAKKLHIRDSVPDIRLEDTNTNAVVELRGNTGTGSFVIATDVNNAVANSKIIFQVDNDEKVRIDNNGNVGIGTTSPTVPLHVDIGSDNNALYLQSSDQFCNIGLIDGSGSGKIIMDSGKLLFTTGGDSSTSFTGSSTRVTIDTSGNVGIGINPTAGFRTSIKGDYSSVVGGIEFDSGGGDKFTVGHASATSPSAKLNVVGAGHLIMATDNTERVRIAHTTGNVGIGTNNPGSALHVVGPNETTFDGITTVQFLGESNYNSGDAGAGILFGGRYNSSNNTTTFAQISGKKLDTTDSTYDGVLTFGVRNDEQGVNIERMRITNTGNVGIGTTSPTQFLEVSAGAPTIGLNSPGQATNKKILRIAASQYNAGDFSIQAMNDDGTTIGANLLTINNAGNVGIGNTQDAKNPPSQIFIARNYSSYNDGNNNKRIDFMANGYTTRNETIRTFHYAYHPIFNQYSWHSIKLGDNSSGTGHTIRYKVIWTTGHASGHGYEEGVCSVVSNHGTANLPSGANNGQGQPHVRMAYQWRNGSFYGWSSTPNVRFYHSSASGTNAQIYMRVEGHGNHNGTTWDMACCHTIHVELYGSNLVTDRTVRFSGHSTPSDAGSSIGVLTLG